MNGIYFGRRYGFLGVVADAIIAFIVIFAILRNPVGSADWVQARGHNVGDIFHSISIFAGHL